MAFHDGYSSKHPVGNISPIFSNQRVSDGLLPVGRNDKQSSLVRNTPFARRSDADKGTSAFPFPSLMHPADDKPHVLVMDDNFEILDILGQLLRDEKYRVTLSCNPLDVEMIDQLQPDVIITDAVFNGKTSGLAAVHSLKADARTRGIPIIYCTLLPHIVQHSSHADLPTIQKPFELDNVLAAVSNALECASSTDCAAHLN